MIGPSGVMRKQRYFESKVHLVSEHVGVAIFSKTAALGFRAEGVLVKLLSDSSLSFQTCVIMRSDDNSRLVNEFVRSFLSRFAYQRRPPKPVDLSLSPRVVRMKKQTPRLAVDRPECRR